MTRDKSTAQIQELFGVAESTVKRWVADGCPCDNGTRGKPRMFSEQEVSAWKKGKGIKPPGTGELLQARIRKENAFAKRAEIETAKLEGTLLDATEVERQNVAKIIAVKTAMMQMGATIAPRLEGLNTAERMDLINDECRRICEEFARGGE